MSDVEYHRDAPGVSSTGLKHLLRSPAHYRAYLAQPHCDTAARRFGRAAHAWLLERPVFDEKFAVWTGGARRGRAFEAFEDSQSGKDILTAEEMNGVQGCTEALLANGDFPLQPFLAGVADGQGGWLQPPAQTEFSIFWTDEETGVRCKARLDALRLVAPVIAFDLKTTDDAREPAFARTMVQLHYDLQAAFYVEAVRRFTGEPCPFVLGAVEVEPPHGNQFFVVAPSSPMFANGLRKVRHALRLLADCQRTGRFSGYPSTGLQEPTLLPWMAFEAPASQVDLPVAA